MYRSCRINLYTVESKGEEDEHRRKIRTYRRNCKLTQKELGEKSVFPIKQSLVGKILVQCQTLKCCHFYIRL